MNKIFLPLLLIITLLTGCNNSSPGRENLLMISLWRTHRAVKKAVG